MLRPSSRPSPSSATARRSSRASLLVLLTGSTSCSRRTSEQLSNRHKQRTSNGSGPNTLPPHMKKSSQSATRVAQKTQLQSFWGYKVRPCIFLFQCPRPRNIKFPSVKCALIIWLCAGLFQHTNSTSNNLPTIRFTIFSCFIVRFAKL